MDHLVIGRTHGYGALLESRFLKSRDILPPKCMLSLTGKATFRL
ncbi:hypothetical protein KSF78_0009350 [Schistosoma japonicum]|nr:hypothetical protein KSF78_0009350 [Schistosoma japonicum]